jgi:tRNA G18 (ribose-2'-O)-methylase SpoU
VPVIPIDDPADARLEDYRNVPDAELIQERGIFVAEGRLVVARLLEGGRFKARSVLVTETALAALGDLLSFRLPASARSATAEAALPVYVVPQWVINAITGFNIHRGCLAIGERTPLRTWQEAAANARRMVLIEKVANADNVGAIFRHAAAFGVDAVLLEPTCTDPLYRKAIRTSMGAALRVPYARVDQWPSALHELGAHGWRLIALTPSAATTLQAVVSGFGGNHCEQKVAIVLGHEGEGLTPEALSACHHHACIPMARGVDSLNVATACAIALYELNRPSA